MNGDVSWYYLNKIAISTAFLAVERILVPWVPEVEKGEMPRCHLQPKAKATSGQFFEQKFVASSGYYKELTETGNHEVTGNPPPPPLPLPRPVIF